MVLLVNAPWRSLLSRYRRLRGTHCHHLQGRVFYLSKGLHSSTRLKASVSLWDNTMDFQCCDHINSYILSGRSHCSVNLVCCLLVRLWTDKQLSKEAMRNFYKCLGSFPQSRNVPIIFVMCFGLSAFNKAVYTGRISVQFDVEYWNVNLLRKYKFG